MVVNMKDRLMIKVTKKAKANVFMEMVLAMKENGIKD